MVRQPFQARLDYTKAAAKTKENQRLLNEVGDGARVWARPAARRAQALFPVRKPSAPGFCHILARNPPRFGQIRQKAVARRPIVPVRSSKASAVLATFRPLFGVSGFHVFRGIPQVC